MPNIAWRLSLPLCLALGARAANQPFEAALQWTVELSKAGCPSGPAIENSYTATRRVVFVGRHVISVCAGGLPKFDGNTFQTVHLISLDVSDGRVSATRQMEASVYVGPYLFRTAYDQVILNTGFNAILLNRDLSETGIGYEISGGRIQNVSPDGTVLGLEQIGGVLRMLDTRSLQPTGLDLVVSSPNTISARSAVTTGTVQPSAPRDFRNGYIVNAGDDAPLYSGGCRQYIQPQFLRNDRVLLSCGDSFQVQEGSHVFFRQRFFGRHVSFAGVSRDGKRFAVAVIERGMFDPWPIKSEEIIINDVDTGKAIAKVGVPLTDFSGEQAWSALSATGDYLVAGGPKVLRLYKIP